MIGICHKCYCTGVPINTKDGNTLCKECEEVDLN